MLKHGPNRQRGVNAPVNGELVFVIAVVEAIDEEDDDEDEKENTERRLTTGAFDYDHEYEYEYEYDLILTKIPRVYFYRAEDCGEIFQFVDDHVDHRVLGLDMSVGQPGGAASRDLVITFPRFLMDQ